MSNDTNETGFDDNFSKLDTNYWFNANAGSGKTFNLVQRFVFLLQNGISVDKILCITYTEAAATEMKKRVIKKIDELIKNDLDKENILKNIDISKLNISTIHSFCRQLLSQQPGYKPLSLLSSDEKTKKKIRNKIYDAISKNRDIADEIMVLSKEKNSVARFKIDIIDKIITNQNKLLDLLENQQNQIIPDFIKQYENQNFEQKKIHLEQKLKTIGTEKMLKLVNFLNGSKQPENLLNIEDWRFVVFTTKLEARKTKKNAEIDVELQNLQKEIISLFKLEENLKVFKTTKSFLNISRTVLNEYKKIKIQEEVETYDDMLYGTLQLAKQGKLPHYDHIMLDEAQDTNPISWKILQLFHGAKFFIVGDQKQSIYGFQGSNIKKYQENYELLKNKAENFEEINLQTSFRSVAEILDLADILCEKKENIFQKTQHLICKENKNLSGSVNIVDISKNFDFQKEQKKRNDSWLENQNKSITNHTKDQQKAVFLAQNIKEIAKQNNGTTALIVPKQTSSGGLIYDILDTINSNFDKKNNDIKIKIKSTSILLKHLLFKDLIAFVNFVILQNDNLNLACLLKSPFFNFTDKEILNLSGNLKNQTLFETMKLTQQNKKIEFAVKILNEFESFSTLNEICEKLKTLAPSEYADFIEIFEKLCNDFCETHSNYELHEFIDFVKDAENGYKKDDENINIKKDEMFIFSTIHGVKGLEFDNVILLNLETKNSVKSDNIHFFDNNRTECFVYAKNNALLDEKLQSIFDGQEQAEIDEKWRLLYVAITRAKRNFYYITDNLQNDKIQYNSFFNNFNTFQDFKQNNCK